MDEPLFGGRSRRDMLIDRFLGGYITVLALVTLAASVYGAYASGVWTHVLLGICTASLASIEVRLVAWYRRGDLEPHFRSIILHLALTLTLLGITANLYFFHTTQ
ncbi:hypothetical protein IW150_005009 [Coemansia sp. RSA 2607]|nr:hypothetical protein IW150_005009 [Coemansia sp. RSA 2607]